MSGILLDTLSQNIDPEVLGYLKADDNLRTSVEDYLQELLINDDLLSTESFTTTSTAKRTLIEEIAELDSQSRDINLKLASITNENRDLIIDINDDLDNVEQTIGTQYGKQIESMLADIKKGRGHSIQVSEKLTNSININNSVLNNIDSILDLLELPTLCRLCILQGNYQESLEISHLSKSLVIRYPKVSIFSSINAKVEIELKLMVKGLIKLLNTNLKQNHIFKIFQILNKLDLLDAGFTSLERDRYLKSIYLNSRFKFIFDEISHLNPFIKYNKLTYLKRFIEIYREYMFNSLSVYYSIFTKQVQTEQQKQQDLLLVNQFITSLTHTLLDELRKYMPELVTSKPDENDEGSIDIHAQKDGLILQLIYLCKSLTKYQVDFESILITELCYGEQPVVSENDWSRNLSKVKKFRSL